MIDISMTPPQKKWPQECRAMGANIRKIREEKILADAEFLNAQSRVFQLEDSLRKTEKTYERRFGFSVDNQAEKCPAPAVNKAAIIEEKNKPKSSSKKPAGYEDWS